MTNRLFFRRERNQITGAWIEIDYNKWSDRGYAVAPRKGRGERKSHPFLRRHVRRRK